MKKHYASAYPELPEDWTIQTIVDDKRGNYYQGLNIRTGFKTSMYKEYAQALATVKDYASQPKYAKPWGV